MRASLIAFLLLFSSACFADSLFLGAWSVHLDGKNYNETHNLIAYERNGWIGGYFKNSFNDDTYFIAKMLTARSYEHVEWGVSVGVMHGYKKEDWGFLNVNDTTLLFNVYLTPKSTFSPTIMNLGGALAITPRIRL